VRVDQVIALPLEFLEEVGSGSVSGEVELVTHNEVCGGALSLFVALLLVNEHVLVGEAPFDVYFLCDVLDLHVLAVQSHLLALISDVLDTPVVEFLQRAGHLHEDGVHRRHFHCVLTPESVAEQTALQLVALCVDDVVERVELKEVTFKYLIAVALVLVTPLEI